MDDADFEMQKIYIKDQIEAASAEARQIFKKASNLIKPGKDIKLNVHDTKSPMSTPILKKLRWVVDKTLFAEIETCPHIDLFNPTVWSVFLGQADFLGCEDCIMSLEQASLVYSPDKCDACDIINVKTFHEYFANVGCILIYGSICSSCLEAQSTIELND